MNENPRQSTSPEVDIDLLLMRAARQYGREFALYLGGYRRRNPFTTGNTPGCAALPQIPQSPTRALSQEIRGQLITGAGKSVQPKPKKTRARKGRP